jgi:hypothetical protein
MHLARLPERHTGSSTSRRAMNKRPYTATYNAAHGIVMAVAFFLLMHAQAVTCGA